MSTEQFEQDGEIAYPPTVSGVSELNQSRRRFTMAGLATSGVIMTLTTRSALASDAVSPSGFCSVNQSRHGARQHSQCRGPTYWQEHASWPIEKTKKFSAIFQQCGSNSPYFLATCLEVVSGKSAKQPASHQGPEAYLMAAYLNALRGWSDDFLTSSQCVNMGNEWLATGVFHPTANVSWNGAQIVQYFQCTQT